MEFEWDAQKAAANVRKHGVSFDEVKTMFGPAKPAIFDDLRHSENEVRYVAIGFSEKSRLLTVSFCQMAPDLIRIISARKATKGEADLYAKLKEQENPN
jgi:uncharacterized DUF497 family protein